MKDQYFNKILADWVITIDPRSSPRYFFDSFADAMAKAFKPRFATVWDNNFLTKHLVMRSTSLRGVYGSDSTTIPIIGTYTGRAVSSADILDYDLTKDVKGVEPYFPRSIKNLGLERMIAIPIPATCDFQWINFVLALCYDHDTWEAQASNGMNTSDLTWVSPYLGRALMHLVDQSSVGIRQLVDAVAGDATSVGELASRVKPSIKARTAVDHFTLFTPLAGRKWRSFCSDVAPETIQRILDQPGHVEDAPWMGTTTRNSRRYEREDPVCDEICYPIKAPDRDEVIGYIYGKTDGKKHSLASLELHLFHAFARELGVRIDRLNQLASSRVLLELGSISSASNSGSINELIDEAIESAQKIFNVDIVSIYLIDENDGTPVYRLRGATEEFSAYLGDAVYEVDEGLTGHIAARNEVMLNSSKEIEQHLSHTRKHPTLIYPVSLLGVPIYNDDGSVLGVLKLERSNRTPEDARQFLPHDRQLARIFADFLSYTIRGRDIGTSRRTPTLSVDRIYFRLLAFVHTLKGRVQDLIGTAESSVTPAWIESLKTIESLAVKELNAALSEYGSPASSDANFEEILTSSIEQLTESCPKIRINVEAALPDSRVFMNEGELFGILEILANNAVDSGASKLTLSAARKPHYTYQQNENINRSVIQLSISNDGRKLDQAERLLVERAIGLELESALDDKTSGFGLPLAQRIALSACGELLLSGADDSSPTFELIIPAQSLSKS